MFSGQSIKRIPLKNIFSVAPADPRANKNALDLLKYFYILSSNQEGNFFLSGQNIGSINGSESISEGYARYFKALEDQTGKLPVIMGIDYGWERLLKDYTEVNKILIDYWRKGGLIEVSMSPSNPFTGNGLRDFGLGGHRYEDLFTTGNEAHDRWMADLDKVASGLNHCALKAHRLSKLSKDN